MKVPTQLEFKQKSRILLVAFGNETYELSYEFLRVFSPSAEVRGHSPEQAQLQVGKANVSIVDVSMVGQYAIKISFSDGHDSGIYTWEWLEELAEKKDFLWKHYLRQLEIAGASRDPADPQNEKFLIKNNQTGRNRQKCH